MHALDQGRQVLDGGLYVGGAGTLDGGVERAQAVELHGLSLGDQLLHAAHRLLEHQHHLLVADLLAVAHHVAGKALQRQRFFGLGFGVVHPVALGFGVLALAEIHQESNVISCHTFVVFFVVLEIYCGRLHRATASRLFSCYKGTKNI